ncbi:SDR family NAD(P)-dependent oxidoreductase [Streptosporangium sp. NPDC004631]
MSVAIVGLACAYPDAPGPGALWETVLWRRRAFRRVPVERLDPAGHRLPGVPGVPGRSATGRVHGGRAGLIEGWEPDRAVFGLPGLDRHVAGPAHRLALDTASRALADAGFPRGEGLDRDRVTVIIGSTGAGTIAGGVCAHFGLRGGGYAVDGACASSLLAVITAGHSLLDGSADFALAGGVDLSLAPFAPAGPAGSGAPSGERMWIYDTRSDGHWPGEGCGVVALARAADARAAGMRIYAEISGWGVSSGGAACPESDGLLLALRRAYARAGIPPAGVALFEGSGTGTAAGDTAELAALTALLSGSVRQAALGSVSANIGHTGAAAGIAGVIKVALSVAHGVLPPTTGCGSPHPLLTAPGTPLRVPASAEPWPDGPRHAGVSAMGFGGVNAHLVLTAPPSSPTTPHSASPAGTVTERPSRDEPLVFGFSAESARALRPVLERVADQAVRWSEAELCDLAHALGTAPAGRVRVAIAAESAERLAERARLALDRLERPDRLDPLDPLDPLETLPGIHLGPDVMSGLAALYHDHPARPMDIWRDRVFIPGALLPAPCPPIPNPYPPNPSVPGLSPAGSLVPNGLPYPGIGRRPLVGTGTPAGDRADAVEPVAGVARWVRCFTEDPEAATAQPADGVETPTRRIVIDDPLRPGAVGELLSAVREAVADREGLAVVCGSDALTGFLATLRLEHPDLDFGPGRPDARTALLLEEEGPLPVGTADVVLVSGGGTGIGFACAVALAEESGCALALLGRDTPDRDTWPSANLAEPAAKGIRHVYVTAEVGDAAQVARAVREVEVTLGPIAMLIHVAGVNRPGRFADLTDEDFEHHVAPELTGLDNLLTAAAPGRVVTFGSVAGRYGLAGESRHALAGGLTRERVRRIGGLNVDWPVWDGTPPGAAAVEPREEVELFLRLLRTEGLPPSVTVHGRPPGPAAPCPGGGRFLDGVRVHVPGVELVADSDLSLKTDAYLDDHRIDGRAVLPAVVALEAMAQAAGALAGRPLDEAVEMTFDRPVVVPDEGGTTIRVCALRHTRTVEVVVRGEETGFQADHFRAVFPVDPADETLAVPELTRDGAEPLDAGDLYGALCFQTGRFQRVRELTLVEARGCRGELHGDDPDGWFDGRPVLGSPGLSDATIHALQACVPHRRLLPVGGERLVVRPSQGDVRLHATERHHGGGEYVWDVTATDVRGRLVAAWTGLRLKDVGPLPRRDPWPPSLLAVYLQRASVAAGLDPALRVTMDGGTFRSPMGELVLGVDEPACCAWERVDEAGEVPTPLPETPLPETLMPETPPTAPPTAPPTEPLTGPCAALLAALLPYCGEPERTVAARIRTAAGCLSGAGRPAAVPLTLAGGHEGGWLLLRAGGDLIASTVVRVRDVPGPVAVSIMTPAPGERSSAPPP